MVLKFNRALAPRGICLPVKDSIARFQNIAKIDREVPVLSKTLWEFAQKNARSLVPGQKLIELVLNDFVNLN